MQNVTKSFKSAGLFLAAAIVAASAGSVQAGVIFSAGETPATGTVENVRFTSSLPGVVTGAAATNTVTGKAGRTSYLVDFAADERLVTFDNPTATPAVPPGVRATDGALRALDIDVQGGAFTTFFYNLRVDQLQGNPIGRFADILVTSFDGTTSGFHQALRNGNNVLTIRADNETLLRGVSISSGSNIADIRQVRLGGLQEAPIPEPSIVLSFSLAGVALWGVRSRRRTGPRAKGGGFAQA
jgi:hypothetical protein